MEYLSVRDLVDVVCLSFSSGVQQNILANPLKQVNLLRLNSPSFYVYCCFVCFRIGIGFCGCWKFALIIFFKATKKFMEVEDIQTISRKANFLGLAAAEPWAVGR